MRNRIQIGLCAPMERAEQARAMGFDYLELGLSWLSGLSEAEFDAAREKLLEIGIETPTFNLFCPATLRITGEVDMEALRTYTSRAMARAAALGGRVLVFGSGASRNVPEWMAKEVGMAQIADFLRMADAMAEPYGLQIAIEPLRRAETNVLNTVSEAASLARALRLPRVGVLGDIFHMVDGGEPITALQDAGDLLLHVHIAEPTRRAYPAEGDGYDYAALFDALKSAGYAGRVSIEGTADNFERDAPEAIRLLKRLG